MANQYGINYGEVLRDSEAIKNSRYGRKKSERQEARQVKQDARQDVLNQRQDEEFAYGKQKRQDADNREGKIQDLTKNFDDDAINADFKKEFPQEWTKINEIYKSDNADQKQAVRNNLIKAVQDIGFVENAPPEQKQQAWDRVVPLQTPEMQERFGPVYNQEVIDLMKYQAQGTAKAMTYAESLNERKLDYKQKRDIIEDKQKAAEATKAPKSERIKTADTSIIGRVIAEKRGGSYLPDPQNPGGYKFKFGVKGAEVEAFKIAKRASRIFMDNPDLTHHEAVDQAESEILAPKDTQTNKDPFGIRK